jgi:hypothetical protein
MATLNIEFSQEFEIQRLRGTLDKMEWFKEKGYRLSLPPSMDADGNYGEKAVLGAGFFFFLNFGYFKRFYPP